MRLLLAPNFSAQTKRFAFGLRQKGLFIVLALFGTTFY
jgi:hypothetical protein